LEEYCRKKGHKVSGTRQELCARVYVLYNSQIPEEPGAKEVEAGKRKNYKFLVNALAPAPDPLKSKNWIGEKEGMVKWPQVTCVDLVKFLIKMDNLYLILHSQPTTLGKVMRTLTMTGSKFFTMKLVKLVLHTPFLISVAAQLCCLSSRKLNKLAWALFMCCIKKTSL